MDKLGEPTKDYAPTAEVNSDLGDTKLLADECNDCRNSKKRSMQLIDVLRAEVRLRFIEVSCCDVFGSGCEIVYFPPGRVVRCDGVGFHSHN